MAWNFIAIKNKMKQKIITKGIFLIVIMLILLAGSVLAFAVSSKYYDGNPLYMKPGQSIDGKFVLQNHAGTEDVTVSADISQGADLIKLIDSGDYLVPKGGRIDVNYIITAPSNAKHGEKFPITIFFGGASSSNEAVALSSNIGTGFEVIIGAESDFVKEEKPSEKIPQYFYIIGIILLIIVIYIIIKKKKIKF